MNNSNSSNCLVELKAGTHLCCIYESEDEHENMLVTLLDQGLKQNEKVLYISESKAEETNLNYFRNTRLDIKPFLESKQLKILNAPEAYVHKGAFNPEGMMALLKNETERALNNGYSALRVISEMSWALHELLGFERLIEHDAKLNDFFPNNKCLAICLYDIRHFEPDALLDVFATHPMIVIGNEVHKNYYYLTPSDFLGENKSTITFHNWLDNLMARKRAEDNLCHLSNAVRISLDSIIISNLKGKIIDVNDATLKMYEINEKNDLIGKNIYNFIAPEEQEQALQDIKDILEGGYHGCKEYNIVTRTGNKIPVETNIDLMTDNEGNPIGFIGIFRDIKKQKDVEEKLKESEEKYRTLFNSSPEAIALIGLDGSVLDCNEVVEKIVGKQKKDLIGKPLLDLSLFGDEDISSLLEIIPKAISGESIGPIDMAMQFGDGKGWIEVFPAILKKNDKAHALQLVVRDITERKNAEEEMKRKLMKFRLEEGKVYLVTETMPTRSIEAYKDLLKVDYKGLVVSRTPEKYFRRIVKKDNFEFLWLAEKSDENSIPPKLQKIELTIENLPMKRAIFIDRLDYLIFKNGFKKTLSFVQHLRELAYLGRHVIIISIDPATLSNQEFCLLEKEGAEIKPRLGNKKLPDEQLKILRFIYEDNLVGGKPSYTKIGQELGISKPTIRKRIRLLISAGYVVESVKGRNKVVEITDLGRNIFFK